MPRDRLAAGGAVIDDLGVIQDVDQLLERLVRRDALNGSAVDLVFDAPTKDWVARRSGPAIDLYLYDIREDLQRRVPTWEDIRESDGLVKARRQPPRRFRLAYLVTAWTQRPEDEHRLLSSLLACFLRNAMIKPGELGGSLEEADLPVYIEVGQPASQERSLADIWSALGGELKPSLDVVVTAPIMIDAITPYGPPVMEGPTIGISSSGAGAETATGRRAAARDGVAAGAAARGDRAQAPRQGTLGRHPAGARHPAMSAGDTGATSVDGHSSPEAPPITDRDASLHYLQARLALLETRVRAAVERRRAGDPDPEDRFRGLYISDAQVDELLAGPTEPLVPTGRRGGRGGCPDRGGAGRRYRGRRRRAHPVPGSWPCVRPQARRPGPAARRAGTRSRSALRAPVRLPPR